MIGSAWAADLLDLLLPSGCVACGTWVRGAEALVCAACTMRLRHATWPRCPRCHHPRGTGRLDEPDCRECREWPAELTAARYAYVLEPPATDLAHALKYEGWRELADFMARSMSTLDPAAVPVGRRAVVPVATPPGRLARRGYNQAALLADRLATLLELPVYEALTRREDGASQTSLTPAERRENVRGAFSTSGPTRAIAGAHLLLVDDVLTTGATAGEAARVLSRAGAASVTLIAFARALPSRPKRGSR